MARLAEFGTLRPRREPIRLPKYPGGAAETAALAPRPIGDPMTPDPKEG
jgi:hypothetical protein